MTWQVHRYVSTRKGGISTGPFSGLNLAHHVGDQPDAVVANRHYLARHLYCEPENIVWMNQTHSNHVRYVTQPCHEPLDDVDGIITTQPGLVLAVMTADCLPVLLSDRHRGIVAALHIGRQGAVSGILGQALELMYHHGAQTGHLHAFLGPSIRGEHYELPADIVDRSEHALPNSRSTTLWGTPSIDLVSGIVHQLACYHITDIDIDPRSTFTDLNLFSYRRDGRTGRFASMIWFS